MMCTLQNDGASQPAAARIHVHDGYAFGKELGSGDGIYYSCEWTVRTCYMCKTALCQTACPQAPFSPTTTASATSMLTSASAAAPASPRALSHARGEHRYRQVR